MWWSNPAGQLAVVRQLALGVCRAPFGVDVVLQHADHAVEGRTDRGRLGAGQRRQRHVETPGLQLVQRANDLRERPHRAADQPEHQHVRGGQQAESDQRQVHEVVPGIEHRARRIAAHHQLAAGKVEGLDRWGRRHQRGEPVRRLAPGFIERRRRAVLLAAGFVEQLDVVGAHPSHALQEGPHRRQALRGIQPQRAVQHLRRDAVGRDDLFLDRCAQAAHPAGRAPPRRTAGSARRRSG